MSMVSLRPCVRKINRVFGLGILSPETIVSPIGETQPVVIVPNHVRKSWQGPTDLDFAWDAGYGLAGLPALPPAEWPTTFKDAFYEGQEAGVQQQDADREWAFQNELAMLATCNTTEGRAW